MKKKKLTNSQKILEAKRKRDLGVSLPVHIVTNFQRRKQQMETLRAMPYPEMLAKFKKGTLTQSLLKSYYSSARKTAMKRLKVLAEKGASYGAEYNNDFLTVRELSTPDVLLKEIRDINTFLNTKRTTLTGLKKERNFIIDYFGRAGFNITYENYPDFIKFMEWFKDSEFVKKMDSDSELLAEAFNTSSSASVDDWREAITEVCRKHGIEVES